MEVSLKYVFFKSEEHETLISAGVSWDVGGTGSKKVGAESFDTVTPPLFFGKGFGDLPDSLDTQAVCPHRLHRRGAPDASYNKIGTTREEGDRHVDRREGAESPWSCSGGSRFNTISNTYSSTSVTSACRAVQSDDPDCRVRAGDADQRPQDLPDHRDDQSGHDLVRQATSSSASRPADPGNRASGKNVGVLAQVHFYLDDILPQVFSWTPFSGVLGPTQPR